MSSGPKRTESEPAAIRAWAEDRTIFLELDDGHIFGFSADRFRRLKSASIEELAEVQIQVFGHALRWEQIDEDITVEGIVNGRFQLPPP